MKLWGGQVLEARTADANMVSSSIRGDEGWIFYCPAHKLYYCHVHQLFYCPLLLLSCPSTHLLLYFPPLHLLPPPTVLPIGHHLPYWVPPHLLPNTSPTAHPITYRPLLHIPTITDPFPMCSCENLMALLISWKAKLCFLLTSCCCCVPWTREGIAEAGRQLW